MIHSYLSRILVAILPGRAREDALERLAEKTLRERDEARALADKAEDELKVAATGEAQRLELIALLADREATLKGTRSRIAELEAELAIARPKAARVDAEEAWERELDTIDGEVPRPLKPIKPLSRTVRPEVELVELTTTVPAWPQPGVEPAKACGWCGNESDGRTCLRPSEGFRSVKLCTQCADDGGTITGNMIRSRVAAREATLLLSPAPARNQRCGCGQAIDISDDEYTVAAGVYTCDGCQAAPVAPVPNRADTIDAALRACLSTGPKRWFEVKLALHDAVFPGVTIEEAEAAESRIGATWDDAGKLCSLPSAPFPAGPSITETEAIAVVENALERLYPCHNLRLVLSASETVIEAVCERYRRKGFEAKAIQGGIFLHQAGP